jgi:ATP-dependent Clp protease ATP-binding subunit ClpA
VVDLAKEEGQALGHQHVGTEHLLLGILAEGHSPAAAALDQAGATLPAARPKVVEAVGERQPETMPGDLPLTARAKRVLERASRFSLQRRSPEIETEHILLAILNVDGTAGQVLRGLGVDLVALQERVAAEPEPAPEPPVPAPAPAGSKARRAPAAKKAPATKTAPAAKKAASPALALEPEPRCPSCGAPLGDGVLSRSVPVHGEAAAGAQVSLVLCPRCGSTLGVGP